MLARFYAYLFAGNIGYLLTALDVITKQLRDRAAEKISSAESLEHDAQVMMSEAAFERTEARVAVNLAEKLAKLTK